MRQHSTAKHDSPTKRVGGSWLYPLLLTMQTAGVVFFYAKAISFYRELVADVAAYIPGAETVIWTLAATAMIQFAYWTRYRLRPAMPDVVIPVLGHFIMFFSRLAFVLPTAVFSMVFIENKLKGKMPIPRYILVLLALFSLYCFTRELERLGIKLMRRPDSTVRTERT